MDEARAELESLQAAERRARLVLRHLAELAGMTPFQAEQMLDDVEQEATKDRAKRAAEATPDVAIRAGRALVPDQPLPAA